MAAATDLPVMLYDIPVRTGPQDQPPRCSCAWPTRCPTSSALKDAAGNPAETARVVADAPDGFEVYSGDDTLTLPLLAVGAVGVIGVATHWAAPEMSEMIAAFQKGDVDKAPRAQRRR